MENKSVKDLKSLIAGNLWMAAILIGLIAIVIVAAAFLFLQNDEDITSVYLNNAGQCPEVSLKLTNRATGDVITIKAKAGQRASANVDPNTIYDYVLDTNSEPDENGMRCYDIDQGTISNIPKGRSVTVNVPSVQATPDPRTPSPQPTEETTPAS